MNLNHLYWSTDYTDFHELYFNSFHKKYNEKIRVNSRLATRQVGVAGQA